MILHLLLRLVTSQQQQRERELRKQHEREQRRRYEEMEQLRREEERRHAEREQVHTLSRASYLNIIAVSRQTVWCHRNLPKFALKLSFVFYFFFC